MKHQSLGSRAATGNTTAVQMDESPFIQGNSVVGVINLTPDFNGTAKLQGSDDNSTFTDISGSTATIATGSIHLVNISALPKYVRLNSASHTSGTVSAGALAY